MDTRIKIVPTLRSGPRLLYGKRGWSVGAIVAVIMLAAAFCAAYWYKSLAPVPGVTNQIKESADDKKTIQEKVSDDALQYRRVNLPSIILQEFAAPNFVISNPAHKEALSLEELKEIRLKFSGRIEAPSKILLLSANKVVGQGNTISPDGKELSLSVDIGSFSARTFPSGIYEVYYDACFAGDMCYKGQYAFYGVSSNS